MSEREALAQALGSSTDRAWLADLLTKRLAEEPGNPLARPILSDAQWQAIIAALRARDREDGLVAFAREMIECAFDGMDVGGGEVQELAHAHGLLSKTTYDPEKHGASMEAEPGDDWYVFAAPLEALPLSPASTEVGDA